MPLFGLSGLVTRSAPQGASELADTIATRRSILSRLRKKLADAAQDLPLDAGLSIVTVTQEEIFDGKDPHEGVAAFFSRRRSEFKER